ncbi:type I methionyl aminopeptidase [Candidatus Parcubacteria bacterium]|nr:type I methionyl aminopeptidase [Candidatus Parcubacteria bacterium]
MVNLKTSKEIKIMQEGGAILAKVLKELVGAAKAGITTLDLDTLARERIASYGATPSFLDNEFPAAICTSINDEIVHGEPSSRILKDGDVLKIDAGLFYKGFHTDTAATVIIGKNSRGSKLAEAAERALEIGINEAQPGNTLGDVGAAIHKYVKSKGFDVPRDLIGHGIGRKLHEEPEVPNYGKSGHGPVLVPGMVIAIEPMVMEGDWRTKESSDSLAYLTADGKLVAHAEHTIAITDKGPIILTQ